MVFIALISNECCLVSPGVMIGLHVKISKVIGKILETQDLAKIFDPESDNGSNDDDLDDDDLVNTSEPTEDFTVALR